MMGVSYLEKLVQCWGRAFQSHPFDHSDHLRGTRASFVRDLGAGPVSEADGGVGRLWSALCHRHHPHSPTGSADDSQGYRDAFFEVMGSLDHFTQSV